MNNINLNRLKHVRELLNDIEEELVPCFAEEDQRLRKLCDTEPFSDDMVQLDLIVSSLEQILTYNKLCRNNVDFVLNFEEEGE